jgi:hypothetical protein
MAQPAGEPALGSGPDLAPEPPREEPVPAVKKPRRTQDDRLISPEQLGLKVLYEPPKSNTSKKSSVDVEYAPSFVLHWTKK